MKIPLDESELTPMQSDAEIGQDAGPMDVASQPRIHILIASNDDAGTSQASHRVQETLASAKHSVSVMQAGSAPLQFAGEVPEVVILDASDDLIADVELCGRLKAMPSGAEIPVLALLDTSANWEHKWEALRGAAADDYLAIQASQAEVESRVELMAQLGRLSRELRVAREQLAKQLRVDDLTQVMNRRFFFQTAHRECSRARRYRRALACLMVEVDHLDRFSKTFGYACSDYVLRIAAHIIRNVMRESDVVARFDDKKFVILLPETDVDGATIVHDKLEQWVGETEFMWQGQELPVTVSIGEAERRWDASDTSMPHLDAQPVGAAPGDQTESETGGFGMADAEDAPNQETSGQENEEGAGPSTREELAELLAEADAALFVAQKGARHPGIFTEYSPGSMGILGAS